MQKKANISTSVRPRKKKAGRNDPCPCGSGRKYKKCCLYRKD
ncbi:MAG: SEC-C metal-binding domain-containing protein [Chloroflexota bacterium]